jgi:hypothetical protein
VLTHASRQPLPWLIFNVRQKMRSALSTSEKIKVARLAIGVLSLAVSYVCLALLPVSTLLGISFGIGSAMTAGARGGASHSVFFLPLAIGVAAWLVASVFGPGLIIRLLCLPSSVGYVAALLFLKKLS